MGVKVAKFGGSSLSDAAQWKRVKAIIESDAKRRYIIPSAPGKRHAQDDKITDLLYGCHNHIVCGKDPAPLFNEITNRYVEITSGLGLDLDIRPILKEAFDNIRKDDTPDFAASRGEYFNGIIMASYIGYTFIDAAEVILFDETGKFDSEKTQEVISKRLASTPNAVIPGFYGSTPDGKIKTFSRGGSDISGAIVARGASADIYENWTDVSGFMMADPRIIQNVKPIRKLTYHELRELSYMGATVLHEDAIFPVRKAGIPMSILNTNAPDEEGTEIVPYIAPNGHKDIITGIAGRKNFSVISIEKAMMNSELGFGRRVLEALEKHSVSFEHMPTGIDTMSVVVSDACIEGKLDEIMFDIREACHPDTLEILPGLCLIATVGRGMVKKPGTAAKLFEALAEAGVNVRMIDQGSSELNIIVGIDNKDFEKAIQTIHDRFVIE